MEYRSVIAWVGCSRLPSPAFITGTSVILAANLAAPILLCLITKQSVPYPSNILIVSWSVSPFDTEVPPASENPETFIPRLRAAIWNVEYVLVDGSKNSRAASFPFSAPSRLPGCFSRSPTAWKRCSNWLLLKSLALTTSLPTKSELKWVGNSHGQKHRDEPSDV